MYNPSFGCMTVECPDIIEVLEYLNNRYKGQSLIDANQQIVDRNLQTTIILRNAVVIESMGMVDNLMARWGKRQR
ncbi:type I secretion system permease/ATPase, partial [Pseudomonas syringae pv. tagetis]